MRAVMRVQMVVGDFRASEAPVLVPVPDGESLDPVPDGEPEVLFEKTARYLTSK